MGSKEGGKGVGSGGGEYCKEDRKAERGVWTVVVERVLSKSKDVYWKRRDEREEEVFMGRGVRCAWN